MGEEDYAKWLADFVWDSYTGRYGTPKRINKLELGHLTRFFVEECRKRGIDPETVDFLHEVFEDLGYWELRDKVVERLNMIAPAPPEPVEVSLSELSGRLEDLGFKIKEEDLRKVENVKRLEDAIERLRRNLEKARRELELERARREAVQKELERLRGAPAPPPPKELSEEQVNELRKLWELEVRGTWARFPREAALYFDVELLPTIKTMPYEKARETVIREAGIYTPPAPPEVVRPPPPEVKARPYAPEVMPAVPMPPKVEVPKAPLSPLKFPRRPASEEIKVLWDAFDYRMRSAGLWPWDYREYFEKYIAQAWFSKWEDVVKSFEMMIKDISEGKPPAVKPTPLPWKEPKDAVLHLLWLGKVKDMDELLMALNMSGVFLDAETVKAIVREEMAKPPEEQDLWLRRTPKEYLEIFLKN